MELRKPMRIERRPQMLKEFLVEDFSSCSSNGFTSYPRKECYTTVRNLLEIDLQNRDSNNLVRSRSKVTSPAISALQRASELVINSVKYFQFSSVKSSSSPKRIKPGNAFLSRSLSLKLLRRSFSRNADKEEVIKRRKSFGNPNKTKQKPVDLPSTVTDKTVSACEHTSRVDGHIRNSESSESTDVVASGINIPDKKNIGRRIDVAVAHSGPIAENEWPTEEKEQFSPISVLDLPFKDDNDDDSSSVEHSLVDTQGTKHNPSKKLRRTESITLLKPIDLETLMSLTETSEDDTVDSTLDNVSKSFDENYIDKKSWDLLRLIKTRMSLACFKFKADTILLEFFRDYMHEVTPSNKSDAVLIKMAEDWINGQHPEMLLEWRVQENRQLYVKDMEKGGRWRELEAEKEEVALELEVAVLSSLVSELLLDLTSF